MAKDTVRVIDEIDHDPAVNKVVVGNNVKMGVELQKSVEKEIELHLEDV